MEEVLNKLSEYQRILGIGQAVSISIFSDGSGNLEYKFYRNPNKRTLMRFEKVQEFLDALPLEVLTDNGFVKTGDK